MKKFSILLLLALTMMACEIVTGTYPIYSFYKKSVIYKCRSKNRDPDETQYRLRDLLESMSTWARWARGQDNPLAKWTVIDNAITEDDWKFLDKVERHVARLQDLWRFRKSYWQNKFLCEYDYYNNDDEKFLKNNFYRIGNLTLVFREAMVDQLHQDSENL